MKIAYAVFALLVLAACAPQAPSPSAITSFEECVAAGNPVMESYPQRCVADGQTFTEQVELPVGDAPAEPNAPETPTGQVTGQDEEDAAPQSAGEREFTIVGSNWAWEPSTITVTKGDTVTLHVTSAEGGHGLAIAEFGVKTGEFGPGETKTVTFTADKAGEFRFFCNVFCGSGHRDMTGTLIVEE